MTAFEAEIQAKTTIKTNADIYLDLMPKHPNFSINCEVYNSEMQTYLFEFFIAFRGKRVLLLNPYNAVQKQRAFYTDTGVTNRT